MKVVESDTGLTYDDAKIKCTELDPISYPAEPYNEYLQNELRNVLLNSTGTETNFWIGKHNSNITINVDYIRENNITLENLKFK